MGSDSDFEPLTQAEAETEAGSLPHVRLPSLSLSPTSKCNEYE